MTIRKNLSKIRQQIDQTGREITLVAVSKGRSLEEIQEAYSLGLRDFGENRLPEALEKMDLLPSDIRWHFIGKLQKNKVKKAIGRFALIHSVDSVELAEKISRLSQELGVVTSILLEVNASGESTKSGLSIEAWEEIFEQLLDLKGIRIRGLMTMAPFTEEEEVIRLCFAKVRCLRERLCKIEDQLTLLSMGMSHDFSIALQEGSTLIRIGRALF